MHVLKTHSHGPNPTVPFHAVRGSYAIGTQMRRVGTVGAGSDFHSLKTRRAVIGDGPVQSGSWFSGSSGPAWIGKPNQAAEGGESARLVRLARSTGLDIC